MKIFLISLLILSSLVTYSQDYQTVYPGRIVHFSGSYFRSIRIDSVSQIQNCQEFFPFHMIRYNPFSGFYTAKGSHWVGKKVSILPGGYNNFYNRQNDTIFINTMANINESWKLFTFPDSRYIIATVTSIEPECFIGLTDSVKTISLQVCQSTGLPVTHCVNDLLIRISKYYGFVTILDFYSFPFEIPSENEWSYDDGYQFDLAGITNPDYGYQNIKASDIFDFNIGDEYQFLEKYSCYGYLDYSSKIIIQKVITKNTEGKGTQINYEYDRCMRVTTQDTSYFVHDTINETIDLQNNYLDKLAYEPYWTEVISYILPVQNGKYDCNSNVFWGNNDTTLGYLCVDPEYCQYFGKNIGGPYYWYDWFCPGSRELVYYTHNGVSYGTPYSCEELSIELPDSRIVLFPNPAGDFVTIRLPGDNRLYELEFFNSTGCLKIKTDISNEKTLCTSQLPSGIYLLVIKDETFVKTSRLVIKK